MHALSIPTWIIHVSSVIEWSVAIWLIWQYATVQADQADRVNQADQNQYHSIQTLRVWRSLAIAMLPALVSAMCACTWHFFDNPATLDWLVDVQAAMTLIGNTALAIAAYFIYVQATPTTK